VSCERDLEISVVFWKVFEQASIINIEVSRTHNSLEFLNEKGSWAKSWFNFVLLRFGEKHRGLISDIRRLEVQEKNDGENYFSNKKNAQI